MSHEIVSNNEIGARRFSPYTAALDAASFVRFTISNLRFEISDLVRHASQARALHQANVLRERSTIRLIGRHLPRLSPCRKFAIRQIHTEEILLRVDRDAVAAADQRNGPAFLRL